MSKVVLLVEGEAEKFALMPAVKSFLDVQCQAAQRRRVALDVRVVGSHLFNEGKAKGIVRRIAATPNLLGIVVLVDVKAPPISRRRSFSSASDAIAYLKDIGEGRTNFHAHAAQHDMEAWLLPYWSTAARKAGVPSVPAPSGLPETIDHDKPPSTRIAEFYARGKKKYSKPRDGADILHGQDLVVAANACPQFKSFLGTLLVLAGCPSLP